MTESTLSTDEFDPAAVADVQWDEIFAESEAVDLYQLSQALLDKGQFLRTEESAHPDAIRAIEVVGHAASMCFTTNQYGDLELYPMLVLEEKRTAAISDFSKQSAKLLATVAPRLSNIQLRARTSDAAWQIDRSLHASGRLAIVSYVRLSIEISSNRENENSPDWSICSDALKRALTLARRHPDKNFVPYLKNRTLNAISLQLDIKGHVSLTTLDSLTSQFNPRDEEIGKLIDRIEDYSKTIEEKDPDLSIRTLRLCTHYHVRSSDNDRANENLKREAVLLESVADGIPTSDIFSVLRAESKLREAIGALERVGETKEERNRLQLKIVDLRSRSEDAWQSVTHTMDLTDISQQSIKHVSGQEPDVALIRLAIIQPYPDRDQEIEKAREQIRENVFSNMIGAQIYGSAGNLEGFVEGVLPGDLPTSDQIETRACRDLRWTIALIVHGVILPALDVVRREHPYRQAEFFHLLGGNRFFRADRHQLVSLGLHHGFMGDFVSASHILIPQIEYSCRTLLREAGINTTIRKEGRELEIDLNTMLREPLAATLEDLLDQNIVFTMKAVLVHRFGGNFRNDLLHGNYSDSVFGSQYACYTWWLCLNLALVPRLYEQASSENLSDAS